MTASFCYKMVDKICHDNTAVLDVFGSAFRVIPVRKFVVQVEFNDKKRIFSSRTKLGRARGRYK